MVGWLADVGWLALVGRSVGCVDWLVGWLVGLLRKDGVAVNKIEIDVYWLVGWRWLVGWLVGWLVD